VVGVLVSVGDQGGGGEHGAADAGRAPEGESSKHPLIRGNQERHGASDVKWERKVSSAQILYQCSHRNARIHLKRGWSTEKLLLKVERLLWNNATFE
jgi:hypothetical protein